MCPLAGEIPIRRFIALAGLALLAPAAGHADPPSATSVTVYNEDLALIEETRPLTLTQGRQRIELPGVSAQIRPETVSLLAPGVTIIEQNFDFDLLTPAALMQKAVGQQVQIVRTNPGNGAEVRETATILSVNNGVVLQIGDRIEVLREDGLPTRVIFPRVPPNLRAEPTLSVTLDADTAGRRDARLSYLTRGLSWKADYVAVMDDRAGRLDLQGWVTLTNRSGTSFENVDVQLVAGDLNLSEDRDAFWRYRQQQGHRSNVRAGVEGATGGADYQLYPVAQPVTVANNQTKQVGFLDASGVQAERGYRFIATEFSSMAAPQSVDSIVRFRNSAATGLGAPLPAGIVRVYMRDHQGELRFVGENYLGHTPQGSELVVKVGEAFDVTAQRTLVSEERQSSGRYTRTVSYVFRNARASGTTIEVQQHMGSEPQVTEESLTGQGRDATTRTWSVNVPANGETTLRYTWVSGR